ncbi:MAG: NUDIX hydrolase [Candidatus Saccharimonadales bacterium]
MPIKHAQIESVAKVLIIDRQNRGLVLILGKHLKHTEKSYLPDLPGGIVDPGESELSAVVREVHEECGITLDPISIQLTYSETAYYEKENKSVTKLLYIAYVDESPSIALSWEHSDYKWIAVQELHTVDLRPFFNDAIRYSSVNNLIKLR